MPWIAAVSEEEDFRALQRQMLAITAKLNKMAGDVPVLLFKDYAQTYLARKLARPTLRKSTKTSFENQVLKHLIPWFGVLPLEKINNTIWIERVTEEKALTKFFNARKALIEILRAACEEGFLTKVPKLDSVDEYENVGRILDLKEIYAILRKSTRPFRLIFYAFWKMGCRPREILQWEWSMIRWSDRAGGLAWIKIPARISKTGRAREIAIDPDVTAYLRERFLRGNRSAFVFPKRTDLAKPQLSYQSAFVTACRKAGVTNAMVYDFRRTFITICAAAGKSLAFVAKHLDTSEVMIRKVYLKDHAETMEGLFS